MTQAFPGTSDDRTVEDLDRHIKEADAGANPIQQAIEALALILLMAKGYAHQHPVRNNSAFCDQAEAALASLRAAQEGDLPPLLTDERIERIAKTIPLEGCEQQTMGWGIGYSKESGFLEPNVPKVAFLFARAIESEVRTAIAAAGGGVPHDALIQARDMLESWSSYVPPYFAEKHGLKDDFATLDKWIASSPQPEAAPAVAQVPRHFDEGYVDRFAQAMKDKLAAARAKGRYGWQACPPEELSRMLREHVEKGDPRDVANFCMFLWSLGHGITTPEAPAQDDKFTQADLNAEYARGRADGWEACVNVMLDAPNAPAQAEDGKVVVTWNHDRTRILAVTRQNTEGQILKVIAEAPAQAALSAGEVERQLIDKLSKSKAVVPVAAPPGDDGIGEYSLTFYFQTWDALTDAHVSWVQRVALSHKDPQR